jgi:hypothetical protein
LTRSSTVSRWNTNLLSLPNIRNWLDALISLIMSALLWKLVSGDRKTKSTSGLESYTLPEVGGVLSHRSFLLLDLLVEGLRSSRRTTSFAAKSALLSANCLANLARIKSLLSLSYSASNWSLELTVTAKIFLLVVFAACKMSKVSISDL